MRPHPKPATRESSWQDFIANAPKQHVTRCPNQSSVRRTRARRPAPRMSPTRSDDATPLCCSLERSVGVTRSLLATPCSKILVEEALKVEETLNFDVRRRTTIDSSCLLGGNRVSWGSQPAKRHTLATACRWRSLGILTRLTCLVHRSLSRFLVCT